MQEWNTNMHLRGTEVFFWGEKQRWYLEGTHKSALRSRDCTAFLSSSLVVKPISPPYTLPLPGLRQYLTYALLSSAPFWIIKLLVSSWDMYHSVPLLRVQVCLNPTLCLKPSSVPPQECNLLNNKSNLYFFQQELSGSACYKHKLYLWNCIAVSQFVLP